MDKKKEIVKELNDFLKGINMGSDTFNTYEKKATDDSLKAEFSKIISTFNSQKKLIISFINELDGNAKDSLGVGGEFASMFEKFKDIFINSDKEVLEHAIKAIDMGVEGGSKVISRLEELGAQKTILTSVKNIIREYETISNHLTIIKNRIYS